MKQFPHTFSKDNKPPRLSWQSSVENIEASDITTRPLTAVSTAVTLLFLAWWWRRQSYVQDRESVDLHPNQHFPFVSIRPESDSHALFHALEKYRSEASNALQAIGRSLEIALQYEQQMADRQSIPHATKFSSKLQARIQQLSKCYDEDESLLRLILQPTKFIISLPHQAEHQEQINVDETSFDTDDDRLPEGPSMIFHASSQTTNSTQNHAYDSVMQVVAHIVRDWSDEGRPIRDVLYRWCCEQLDRHSKHKHLPVLVPGAGLGRLAFDISSRGYIVEANELSAVMATAAHSILNKQVQGSIHPFAMDYFRNEVDSSRRYDEVYFPDTQPSKLSAVNQGRLSYTIGDFVSSYYVTPSQANSFEAVVTCFFVDTATNLYEYLDLIHHLLKPGGVWVNVGPVQWHQHAALTPSVDELKDLITFTATGFRIVHWSIDSNPIPYRDLGEESGGGLGSFIRTTNFDGYRPLRFVAIRK